MGHKNFGRNDPRFWGESRAERVARYMRVTDSQIGQ
jgi:hypothetical protein